LRIIQEISGHRNLEQLQKYLEVRPDQVRGAVSALSTLSYIRKPSFAAIAHLGACRRGFHFGNRVPSTQPSLTLISI